MWNEDKGLVSDTRWDLVERVAASDTFANTPALRSFLFYICERALNGHPEDIKEQRIGHRVLGRRPDYNPAEDNIVRVRARELRHRLDEYFANAGKDEPVVIVLPKGGYVPIFQPRSAEAPEAEPPPARASNRRSLLLAWTLVGVLAALCAWLLVRGTLRQTPSPAPELGAARRIWSQFFRPDQETLVVAADSNFVLLQDLTRQSLGLQEYVHQRYLQRPEFKDPSLALIASRRYTGLGELNAVVRILRIANDLSGQARVRFARTLDVRDLKQGNIILMGASRSNPWVELFEPQCNFLFRYDTRRNAPFIENKSPREGEAATYRSDTVNNAVVSYATVTLLPNLSDTGLVLIISGLRTEGTEAASEFVTQPDACARLLRKVGLGDAGPLRPFEALIKLTPIAGGSGASEVIAVRRPKG